MTNTDGKPHVRGDTATTTSSFLPLDDGDIHVCQDGPPDAHTLLLIHGSASSTRSWDQLVPALTSSHHIVRIDLLGHGQSGKPAGPSYEIAEQGRRAGEVLDWLGVERATVVGHSTGGSVATALAEQRPDLVTALALINTGPNLDAYIAPEVAIDLSQWPPPDDQIQQLASAAFSHPDYQVPPEVVDDARGMTHHTFTAAFQAAKAYLDQRTLPDRLTALETPLQVIFGERDRRWRSSSAADYRAVPGARVELLPDSGHSPPLEEPSRTGALLLAFTAAHATRDD